jgi:predicted amidophosphoribosyltransferase
METYPKLSDFFGLINEAHLELQKLLPELCEVCGKQYNFIECGWGDHIPELCEVCGKPAWECDCEEHI